MYYEGARLKHGDTASGLATEYAYKAVDWAKIWRDPRNASLVSRRKDPARGTTKWPAVVSLAVVTEKRVTVYKSYVWGWNMPPANVISAVGPREATGPEVMGHVNLLRKGMGKTTDFKTGGWTFRSA